jgi:enoyl-CoA hydratase
VSDDESGGAGPAAWYENWSQGPGSPWHGRPQPDDGGEYRTLTYERDGRIARITFNRPEQGNAITPDTPRDLAHAVERADLDPRVHVIVVSGRGKGFCGGYDLDLFAERGFATGAGIDEFTGTVLDPGVNAVNHDPSSTWDPMIDYAMMSRYNKGFASLLHANKPTVAKLHGFAVAGGTDIAAASMWAHRLGDQRAKRLLFTGDCLSGKQAAEWGLAVESCPADELDARTEALLARIARVPVNQLMMAKLALNSALYAQGVVNSGMISTVFDGISRHTREGYAFQQRAADVGFREAVRERDEPFGDHKRARGSTAS